MPSNAPSPGMERRRAASAALFVPGDPLLDLGFVLLGDEVRVGVLLEEFLELLDRALLVLGRLVLERAIVELRRFLLALLRGDDLRIHLGLFGGLRPHLAAGGPRRLGPFP